MKGGDPVSKSMKILAAASVLAFGTAVSGAALAECTGSHAAKSDQMTSVTKTGAQSQQSES